MWKKRIELRPFVADATAYLGFSTITYCVALYEGATLLSAIPVVCAAGTAKYVWWKTLSKLFPNNEEDSGLCNPE